ncbi:MAG: hypothetical protein QOC80_344 [Frankiaceae bacterium]|nr:hypothetical protein [Frankiaceae bacterium]
MTLLVTGATGTVGGALVALLSASLPAGRSGSNVGGRAQPVEARVMVPSPEDADDLRGYDVEIVVGDFDAPETLDDALKGIDTVFLSVPAGPGLATRELAFLDAVTRSPQRPHVVLLAGMGWEEPRSRLSEGHREVVNRLREDGMKHTVIAPNGFMQDTLQLASMVARESALLLPAGDGAVSHVDARDVAAVAAHVLGDPAPHDGRSYTVTGPAALTYTEVAEQISAVAGKAVTYTETDPAEVRERLLGYNWAEWTADGMLEVYAAYRDGVGSTVTDEVEKATGHPARSFADFLRDHAAAFRSI